MIGTLIVLAAVATGEPTAISTQIMLDRAGFSCNFIDGVWGQKSDRARELYALSDIKPSREPLFCTEEVTEAQIASLVKIPDSPQEKAELDHMGYESIREMYSERGHVSPRCLAKLNPHITDWDNIKAGTKIKIPNFPSIDADLDSWPRKKYDTRAEATLIRISLSRYEITAYDAKGKIIAAFPCSIAKDKAKLPPHGELKVVNTIANPNYTYSDGKAKPTKYIYSPGPNCPVGVAWIGLNLSGYGIHGTPKPESIGSSESHGCFRLSNWNAARLYSMVKAGTKVIVEE